MVILAKTLSPQENRIHRAQAVNNHGERKKVTVSEPGHGDRLNVEMDGASGNSEVDLTAGMAPVRWTVFDFCEFRLMLKKTDEVSHPMNFTIKRILFCAIHRPPSADRGVGC